MTEDTALTSSAQLDPWTPLAERLEHRVTTLGLVTPVIAELTLAPLAEPLAYRPGQYVLIEDGAGEVAPRSFSVANAPRAGGELTLLATRVAGGQCSDWIHGSLAVGDTVLVSGPYGTLTEERGVTAPALHLAAGSGLAPLRALLEAQFAARSRSALTLVFSARSEADVIDANVWASSSRREPRFRFIRTLTGDGPGAPPRGRIPALLGELGLGDLVATDVFIAGNSGFVGGCVAAARALGAPRAQIYTEVFYGEPEPWTGAEPR